MRAAVLGATGYTGMVLLRLLLQHPEIHQILPVSRSQKGNSIPSVDPGIGSELSKFSLCNGAYLPIEEIAPLSPDVVFSALPHLASAECCRPFAGKALIIDLSADLRIASPELFLKAYGEKPPAPDLLEKSVYGLTELYYKELKTKDIIANPGCYPTATLLPLIPLQQRGLLQGTITINALSGISGAGKKAKTNLLFCEREENACLYAPGSTHRHVTEIEKELNNFGPQRKICFNPHLIPLKRGMVVTSVLPLSTPLTAAEVGSLYEDFYGDAPFIGLHPHHLPETREVRGSNRCDIGWHFEENVLVVTSVLDNLMKGASGQAVQNMNVRLGFAETAGLMTAGEV